MTYYIPQIIYTAFFWEWWQKDLFGFQSHSFISWDERWRTCFEVWGHISLSVRPLLFHPCLTLPLSLSRLLSRAEARASSVYSSYCMTYTWRVWSLFMDRTPSAWVHRLDHFSYCFSPNLFISLRGRRLHCIHANQGASGSPAQAERTDEAGHVFSCLTRPPVYIHANLWKFVKGKQLNLVNLLTLRVWITFTA